MNIDSEEFKKVRIRYLKCPRGDLHQGEVLNFICVDPLCSSKGLICPVCQSTTHQGHHTLHLKIFLAEVNRNLYQKSEFCGLGSYLVSLDNTKREMVKALKEAVEQMSSRIKEVEEKIEEGYCMLRRVILSQVV
jgi:hypothetical protein